MPSIVTKFHVEGMREARANAVKLQRLTTGSMRDALTKAHRPMVRAAKSFAPKDTGLLKKSIASKIITNVRESVVLAIIGADRNVWALIDGEHRQPSRYAHLVELGRGGEKKIGAHPFLRPAYESEMKAAIDAYGRNLGPAIEKTAERLSRTSYQPGRRR